PPSGFDVTQLSGSSRFPVSPHDDHQIRSRDDAFPAEIAGQPARGHAIDSHRRNQREGKRQYVDCSRTGGSRLAGGTVHFAAPGVLSRADPGRWRPISEDAVAMWTERLLSPILERKATFFEATTALAFADFAARGAEIAVIEVGLGGRLDSTNVVQPLVSGVTKIERDHMKYLGDTLELIATEKAGIAKPGVPFVIGERDPALVEV